MRILYIHQHFRLPDEAGGTRSWEFARRLVQDGHSVTVIAAGSTKEIRHESGVTVRRLAVSYDNTMGMSRRMVAFLIFMLGACVVTCRHRSDVVLASSTPLTVAVPGMLAAALWRARFILEVRDLWPSVPIQLGVLKNPLVKQAALLLEWLAYRRAERIIALSPGMAEGVRSRRPNADIVVVPNAADLDLFRCTEDERGQIRSDLGWRETEAVVVYAGSFGHTYGMEWVVQLAACMRRSSVRLILIGSGASWSRCRELAEQCGLDAEGLLLGTMSKRDVARYIKACDLTISSVVDMPALEPASINKVFDSLAAGRPVLMAHRGWLTDLVTKAGAGWRLDRASVEEASTFVQALMADKVAVENASQAAAELGQAFDRERLYHRFREALGVQSSSQPNSARGSDPFRRERT